MEDSSKIIHRIKAEAPWFILFVWCLAGLWGHLKYVDDTTELRLLVLSYCGIPLTILTLAVQLMYPQLLQKRPRIRRMIMTGVFLIFFPGYILLFNGLENHSPLIKRTMTIQGQIAIRDVKRGQLGILYTRRF